MAKRKTAGELSLKASSDNTKYDPLEIGYALTDDVIKQLHICAERHEKIFDEEEFFLCLIVAGDPLIQNVRRHKYAAFLYMPNPRPEQSCYLYRKADQSIKRLWTLPSAKVMATVSSLMYVHPKWQLTKSWCDAFYAGFKFDKDKNAWVNGTPSIFFDVIRHQNNIDHLSEKEYLDAHREELIKSGSNEVNAPVSQPFDFSKIKIDHIIDTKTALVDKDTL